MKTFALTRYSAIACIIAMVGCSSDDDPAADAGTGGSGGSGGSGAVEAGAADRQALPDVASESAADGRADVAVDAGRDVAADVALDVASEARSEASTEGGAGEGAAPDGATPTEAGEAGSDAIVAEAGAEASASEGGGSPTDGGGFVREGCTPPAVTAVTPSSSTILDMEAPTGIFTQAVASGAGNWALPAVEAISADAGTRFPPANMPQYSPITPARGASTKGIHSTGSGYQYAAPVIMALLDAQFVPLNATQYGGITFFAKGSALTARVSVEVSLTSTLPDFCLCDPGDGMPGGRPSRCYDNPNTVITLGPDWQQFTIPWSQFAQSGYGNPVPTDPSKLLNVVFRPVPAAGGAAGTWDFWLDDVAFAAPVQ